MASAQVRDIVHRVEAAIGFYAGQLGFERVMRPAPGCWWQARLEGGGSGGGG